MRRAAHLVLILLLLATGSLLPADEEDPKTKFLKELAKTFKSGSASTIAKNFPEKRKVELRLRGILPGRYRSGQARSLLATYFSRTIEPLKYELKGIRGSVAKYKMQYRVRADGRRVEGTTCVYLEESDDRWLIVGIVEY